MTWLVKTRENLPFVSRTTIVIPCYNESARLNVDRIVQFSRNHRTIDLLFVNDGSTDDTSAILRSLVRFLGSRCSLVEFSENQGKAEAVRTGLLVAIARGAEYVGYWDADLAAPLEAIPRFQDCLRRNPASEMVLGIRLPLLGRRIQRSRIRTLLGRVFAFAARVVLGIRVTDVQCGAKLLRATPRLTRVLEERFLARWIFDVELVARLARSHRDSECSKNWVHELPLDEWREVKGSKLRIWDFGRAVSDLTRIWWRFRVRRPDLSVDTPRLVGLLPILDPAELISAIRPAGTCTASAETIVDCQSQS